MKKSILFIFGSFFLLSFYSSQAIEKGKTEYNNSRTISQERGSNKKELAEILDLLKKAEEGLANIKVKTGAEKKAVINTKFQLDVLKSCLIKAKKCLNFTAGKVVKIPGLFFKVTKSILLTIISISKEGFDYAGKGLGVLKNMIDLLKSVCDLFWSNVKSSVEILQVSLKLGFTVGAASLIVFALLARWFNFTGVMVNIKEIVSLMGHPIVKRLVRMIKRMLNFTERSIESTCSVINSSENGTGFKDKVLTKTVGWWFKPLLCYDLETIKPSVNSVSSSKLSWLSGLMLGRL